MFTLPAVDGAALLGGVALHQSGAITVQCLAAAGVSIISHSEVWSYDGPGNGTGSVESVVDYAVSRGVLWVNSAGNEAKLHWSGPWQDLDGSGLLDFVPGDKINRGNLPASALSLRFGGMIGENTSVG